MKKLAIEGHKTRGKEVIELLEILGGKNNDYCCGGFISRIYFINEDGYIESCDKMHHLDYFQLSLEEYFQKFPFKVGDRVGIPEYESEVRINAMKWDVYSNTVLYMVYRVDEEEWYNAEELLDYNDVEDYKSRYIKTNDDVGITNKTLGIKGHSTRSEDVKSLLTVLGGQINVEDLPFDNDNFVLYIGNDFCIYSSIVDSFKGILFSLEEFENKFPYKIGDKVIIKCKNKKAIVDGIVWCGNSITYWLKYDDITSKWRIEHIQSCKEETITIDDFKANTKEWLIDKLESMSKDNALQTICNIYDELHKPKYPKTYEECCKNVFKLVHEGMTIDVPMHYSPLIINFTKLLICRDAYWKIAGEEMGLDKPWKPDFIDDSIKYNIFSYENEIILNDNNWSNRILVFPTAEMRDTFYENFKDLIEKCKELL